MLPAYYISELYFPPAVDKEDSSKTKDNNRGQLFINTYLSAAAYISAASVSKIQMSVCFV